MLKARKFWSWLKIWASITRTSIFVYYLRLFGDLWLCIRRILWMMLSTNSWQIAKAWFKFWEEGQESSRSAVITHDYRFAPLRGAPEMWTRSANWSSPFRSLPGQTRWAMSSQVCSTWQGIWGRPTPYWGVPVVKSTDWMFQMPLRSVLIEWKLCWQKPVV